MTDTEKAAILDWLLEPQQDRPDRGKIIARTQSKSNLQMLWAFHVWGSKEDFIRTAQEQMRVSVHS